MKYIFNAILIFSVLISCSSVRYFGRVGFKSVHIDTLFQDKINIRAILVDGNKIWYAADHSRFGFYDLKKNIKKESIIKDSLKLEFRSIAQTSTSIFILNIIVVR